MPPQASVTVTGMHSAETCITTGHQLPLPGLPVLTVGHAPSLRVGVLRRSSAAVSVHQFHQLFGLPWRPTPNLEGVPDQLLELRVNLIREEAEEFAQAVADRDLTAIADALADLVYVTYGAALTLGIDLDDAVAEVHRSNLTKLSADGTPELRHDGKVLKPDSYEPPELEPVLSMQPPMARPARPVNR